jgi:hypothetical protein
MHYLAKKLIRRKPKLMPWFMWKGLLLIEAAMTSVDANRSLIRRSSSKAFARFISPMPGL